MENIDFKVGDTVYIVTRGFNGNGKGNIESVKTDRVKTVTAKRGIVKLEKSSTEFKLDGYPAKRSEFSVYSTRLELYNADLIRDIRITKIVRAAHALTFDTVTNMDRDSQIELYDALKLNMQPKENIEE